MPQLNRLIEAGVVERSAALTTRTGGRAPTRYDVADPFLTFWYRFIDPRRGVINRARSAEDGAEIAAAISATIDEYIGRYVFEGVCREWVWDAAARGALPADLRVRAVGTWWGRRDGVRDEIDVVALTTAGDGVLYGECKWSVAPMDMRDLGGLRAAIDAARLDISPWISPRSTARGASSSPAQDFTPTCAPSPRPLRIASSWSVSTNSTAKRHPATTRG